MAIGCSGDGGNSPEPTATVTQNAQTAVPTANPLASPEPDGARVLEHVRKLAAEIGPRTAGTPGELEARNYLQKTLQSYGYDVTFQQVPFDATRFQPARVDAGATAYGALALQGSGDGEAEGPLVSAGVGRAGDFPPGGLGGAVALTQRGELTFAEKVANAEAAGASAVIIYNNETGRFLGETSETTIPVVALSKEDGEAIAAQLGGGPLSAKVTVTAAQGTGYNVIARPESTRACDTVSGGHYDSVPVTGGADDNASGTAAVLELARVVAVSELPGNHCFVLFTAEEFGLFGSREFVNQLTIQERNELDAMLNFDVVGVSDPLALIGSADLVEEARLQAQALAIEARPAELSGGAASDHVSFQDAGIPVVMFNRRDDLIHTAQDDITRINAQSLEDVVRVGVAVLRELSAP